MARPTETIRQAPLTRSSIIGATRALLSSTDLDHLSLRKLAATLGVTAPALYAHFDDKEDLLRAVAESGFADLVARFDEVESGDPVERLRSFSRAYVELAIADPEVFKVMFMFRPAALELPGVDNDLAAADAAFSQPAEAVADAIAGGDIHPDRDPFQTSMVLWTATHGCAAVMLLGSQNGAVIIPNMLEGLVDNVIDVTLTGLASPPRSN